MVLHLLTVILSVGSTLAEFTRDCPPATDILPCTCKVSAYEEQLFCNNMTSLDPVLRVMESHFEPRIPRLFLTHLQSSSLPSRALGDIRVTYLEFPDGNISEISEDAFLGQRDSISSLYLDRNKLEDVPTKAVQQLTSLSKLSLSGNILKKIPDGSLGYLDTVTRLNLSGNLISEIGKNAFPGKLIELDISGKLLSTFNGSLRSPLNLLLVDASHNEFTRMKGEFDGVVHLHILHLDHNRISDISGSFSNLLSIHELSLAGNGIREVGEALVGLNHLQHLNLAQNDIRNINPKVFENMTDLRHLDLSGNLLKTIEICPIFRPSSSPRGIQLSYSSFKTLQPDCYNFVLRFVNLSNNQLSALRLPHATTLKTLDISFNNFRSLETLELPMYGSAKLEMEGNPFRCSKETTPSLKDLKARGYKFPHGFPQCIRTVAFLLQMNYLLVIP